MPSFNQSIIVIYIAAISIMNFVQRRSTKLCLQHNPKMSSILEILIVYSFIIIRLICFYQLSILYSFIFIYLLFSRSSIYCSVVHLFHRLSIHLIVHFFNCLFIHELINLIHLFIPVLLHT